MYPVTNKMVWNSWICNHAGIDFVDSCGHEKTGWASGCLISRSGKIRTRNANAPHSTALDSVGIVRFVCRMGLCCIVDWERRQSNSSESRDRHFWKRHVFASRSKQVKWWLEIVISQFDSSLLRSFDGTISWPLFGFHNSAWRSRT